MLVMCEYAANPTFMRLLRWLLWPALAPALACSSAQATVAEELQCAGLRWSVKTATDSDADRVDTTPQRTSVAELTALGAPDVSDLKLGGRVAPVELTTYELRDVTLVDYEESPDLDVSIHVADQGTTDPVMFVELPDPSCFGDSGRFASEMRAARSSFEAEHPLSGKFTPVGAPFSVVGIGFWDVPHNEGAAPNSIELHPVLKICFGEGCEPQ